MLTGTHLIETSCQASFLGRGEDQSLVVTLDHLVGDPLKVPRPLAHLVRPDGHLDHVVLTDGSHGLGCGVVGSSSILKQTHGLLSWGQGVDDEAEGGRHTLRLLSTPSLTLVQRQVPDGVIRLSLVVNICQFLKSHLT